MRNLTHQQELFARLVADGSSQAEAYRAAYPKSKSWKQKAVYSKASELMRHGGVAGRVAEFHDQLSEQGLWSREMAVLALLEAYTAALGGCNPSGMIAAIKELNVMHGFNTPPPMAKQREWDPPPQVFIKFAG